MKKNSRRRTGILDGKYFGSLKTVMLILLTLFAIVSKGWSQCTPQPVVPNIALSNYSPCSGSSVTVSVTNMWLPNSNWAANIVYPNGVFPINTNGNYTITPTASGNIYVYIFNNPNNCPTTYTSGTQTITLLPGNRPTAQSDTIIRFCVGDSKTLFVTVPNSASSFQWKKNGVNIGTNNDTLFLNNLTASDTGNYKCYVSSSTCPSDSSKQIKLQLGSIVSQSPNSNLCVGGSGFLWVNAPSANGFVWKLNGVAIQNSNNDTLFITNYSTAQAGTYTCEATQNGSCLSSATFTVTTNTNVTLFDFNGVIASYPMSGNANNAVSNSNNGVVNGGCTLTSDRNGIASKAYNFDGSINGTINMGDITSMNGAPQLSICGWFKRNVSQHNEYFSKVTDSSGVFAREYGYNLYTYNTFGNNSPGIPSGNIGGGWANWYHYAMTFNGGAMKIYINGVLASQFTNAAKPIIQSTTGSSFILGDILGGGTAQYPSTNFLGQMDEINIFSRELSSSEILPLMNAPQFLMHPQNVTLCAGNTLSLSVQAESSTAVFQWQKNGVDIVGANQAVYSKSNAQAADAGTYTCIISVGCNRSISKAATVSVTANSTNITSHPQSQSKCVGQSALFSISSSGGTGYQWRKNGVNINGQNSSTLSFSAVSLSDTGTYTCVVSGGSCGSITSNNAYLSVSSGPSMSVSPSSVTLCAGSSITLTASGASTYVWSNNGGNNASASYSPAVSTTYTVTGTDAFGCTSTTTRNVTVNPLPIAFMSFTSSPSICPGQSIVANATGGGTYVWSNNAGTGSQVVLSPTVTTTYTVTVTTNSCSATASNTVTVLPVTTITVQPQSQTTCTGGSLTLNVTATGSNLTYLWKKNGSVVGNNSSTFTISNATASNAGTYTVDVVGDCGFSVSSDAVVTIVGTLQITQQPQSVSVCEGGNTSLSVNANGSQTTYVWKKNGIVIPNSNNSVLTLNNVNTSSAGSYTCEINSSCGNATTSTANVTVKAKTFSSITQSVCFGSNFSFNGHTLTQSGIYNDTLLNAAGCDSIITLNLNVLPQTISSQHRVVCNGTPINFNGQLISQAGLYYDTLTSAVGCDSIIALTVSVAVSSTSSLNETSCGSFILNGQTYNSSGTYTQMINNASGCDSIVTLNLVVLQPTTSSFNDTICAGSTYLFGSQTLSTSGAYSQTIPNTQGCDSTITLNLFVRPSVIPIVNVSGQTLSSVDVWSSYQWLLNGAVISGENAQTYTASVSGSYSLQITDSNGCIGSSSSLQVTIVGIGNIPSPVEVNVFPNPFTESVKIKTNSDENFEYMIIDLNGRIIQKSTFSSEVLVNFQNAQSGNYILNIKDVNGNQSQYKIVKQ